MSTIIAPGVVAGAGALFISSITTNGLTPSAVLPSSENSAYPALNVTDYQHPQRPWKPTSTNQETLVLNLGNTYNLGAIHIGWLAPDTIASFQLQANATNTWSSPTVNVTINIGDAYCPMTRRYAYTHILNPGVAGIQFIRAVFPVHTGNPVAVGQFFAMKYNANAFVTNRPGWEMGFRQASAENRFEGGGFERLAYGPRQLLLSYPWEYGYNYLDGSAPETSIVENELMASSDEPLLIVRDSVYLPEYGSVFKRVDGDVAMTSTAGVGIAVSLSYEEVVA